jgi:hypothetical protein
MAFVDHIRKASPRVIDVHGENGQSRDVRVDVLTRGSKKASAEGSGTHHPRIKGRAQHVRLEVLVREAGELADGFARNKVEALLLSHRVDHEGALVFVGNGVGHRATLKTWFAVGRSGTMGSKGQGLSQLINRLGGEGGRMPPA